MTEGGSTGGRSGGKTDWVGRTIDGRYKVERVLGAGGMGTVYLALDERMDRKVVVKVPHARLLDDEGFRARFAKEIRSLTSLSHPHIVKALDAGEAAARNGEEATPFAVLEFLEGGSLKDRIESKGLQSPQDVLAWLPDVAKALDFIHAQGVVHRDVKPGNILFDRAGNAILADFGIAKALSTLETGLTRTGFTPGSPPYMGPEVGLGSTLGPSYDQYALGVLVYEAMSGALPHEGTSGEVLIAKKAYVEPTDLGTKAPKVAAGVRTAVMRAIARTPAARFASCRAFADALAAGLSSPSRDGIKGTKAKGAKPADATLVDPDVGEAASEETPPPKREKKPPKRDTKAQTPPPTPPPAPPVERKGPSPADVAVQPKRRDPTPASPDRSHLLVPPPKPPPPAPPPLPPKPAARPPKKTSPVAGCLVVLLTLGGIGYAAKQCRNDDPDSKSRGVHSNRGVLDAGSVKLLGVWTLDVEQTQYRAGPTVIEIPGSDRGGDHVIESRGNLPPDIFDFQATLELKGDFTFVSELTDANNVVAKRSEGTWSRSGSDVTLVLSKVNGRTPTGSSAEPARLVHEDDLLVTVPQGPKDVARVFRRTIPGPPPLGVIPDDVPEGPIPGSGK